MKKEDVGGIVEREEFDSGFLMLPNTTAQDSNLTPGALGLLSFICSLPLTWVVRDGHVRAHFGIGRDALRSIYRCLELAGYAQRKHRVRQSNGQFTTVTKISRKPIYLNKFDQGRFSASGQPASGKPTTIQRGIKKRPHQEKNTPFLDIDEINSERGFSKRNSQKKPSPKAMSKSTPSGRSFYEKFGFSFAPYSNLLDENEAVRVAMLQKLDATQIQRALGEFSSMSSRGFSKSAADAWFWACHRQAGDGLVHTAKGDSRLPSFE